MANTVTQKDRILSPRSRKLANGIGPSPRSVENLKKNDPRKSVGIGYVDDGLQGIFETRKHVFKK